METTLSIALIFQKTLAAMENKNFYSKHKVPFSKRFLREKVTKLFFLLQWILITEMGKYPLYQEVNQKNQYLHFKIIFFLSFINFQIYIEIEAIVAWDKKKT